VIDTRRVLRAREVTALIVTHDREEAAALSDRMALMRDGTIIQSGTLDELLAQPADAWVRDFLD
jgi:ABC-type proline/glycine betaine transport system ATPase subunit